MISRNEEETVALALRFADGLAPGTLVSLEGDLGAGKTVFVRGLARSAGIPEGRVTSPSYVLAVEHEGPSGSILHADLYRLPDGASIDDLGFEEALDDGFLVVVEWGERLPPPLHERAWRVRISRGSTPESREIAISPPDSAPGTAHSTR